MTQKEWLLKELHKLIEKTEQADDTNLITATLYNNRGVKWGYDNRGNPIKVPNGVRTIDLSIIFLEVECLK